MAADQEKVLTARLDDYELIAQELSGLAEKVGHLENRIGDVLTRVTGACLRMRLVDPGAMGECEARTQQGAPIVQLSGRLRTRPRAAPARRGGSALILRQAPDVEKAKRAAGRGCADHDARRPARISGYLLGMQVARAAMTACTVHGGRRSRTDQLLVHPAGSSVGYPASGSAFVARTQGAPIVQLSGRPRTRPRAARRRREAAELPAGCTSTGLRWDLPSQRESALQGRTSSTSPNSCQR